MKVTAVIAEYNPIHSGHIKHLECARKDTGADFIIAVMSGDYVQRGCPAVISKYERTKEALMAGADLVLELPLPYSTGSLEYFAKGAVSLIQKTWVAGCISFGSECGDLSLLKKTAYLTCIPDEGQSDRIKALLAEGVSYSNAINNISDLPTDIGNILKAPNNLLAVSYIKAAADLSFACEFHTMKRTLAAYHDDSAGAVSSTAIRKDILKERDLNPECVFGIINDMESLAGLHNVLESRMPDEIRDSLLDHLKVHPPLCEDDFSLLLFYKLQSICNGQDKAAATEELISYLDVSPSLAGKIINKYMHASSFSHLCDELKSKDLNRSRINRALLHILLDIKKDHMDEYIKDGYNYYINPLGFKKSASALLHAIKKEAGIPLISKNADAAAVFDRHYTADTPTLIIDETMEPSSYTKARKANRMFNDGIRAGDLYNKTACTMCRRPFISGYEISPVVL